MQRRQRRCLCWGGAIVSTLDGPPCLHPTDQRGSDGFQDAETAAAALQATEAEADSESCQLQGDLVGALRHIREANRCGERCRGRGAFQGHC